MNTYEPVIGLEVHVQLGTRTKAFCGCSTEFGAKPNSHVCPVCLGLPGTLPVLNKTAFNFAIKVGLALNCRVQEYTKFDRKHYYYPDLPKNYQISQYDLPVAKGGFLEIELEGSLIRIGITRVHLEEDAGKLIHKPDASLVDLNRAGIPLLEVVSEPDIHSASEAYEYLSSLKSIIKYLDVSDCDMEKGSLRCDANISIRPKGQTQLGVKTELKNMNSFKGVKDALEFEIQRQGSVLEAGGSIIQETRLWDAQEGKTYIMRTKEEAKDYRYFPEPDLPPYIVTKEQIEESAKSIPELPQQKSLRFQQEYGLLKYDAGILVSDKQDGSYAEECLKNYPGANKKLIVNWLIGPLLSVANTRGKRIWELGVSPAGLIELTGYLDRREISNLTAKTVLTEMIETKKAPSVIIKEKNLLQISDTASLETVVADVLKENADVAQEYRGGKCSALMFLVGQAMKKSNGKANPKLMQELLKRRLADA